MNGPLDSQNNADEILRWIDRLVDGELNRDDERQVLLALEAQPEYWRRCALAFVESQTWRGELRGLASEPAGEVATNKAASLVRRSSRVVLQWAALAASVLIAFTLGIAARHIWTGGGEQIAAGNAGQTNFVTMTEPPTKGGEPKTPDAASGSAPESNNDMDMIPRNTVQVSLPIDDGQEEQSVTVPVVEANEQRLRSLFAGQMPVIPEVALKALQSSGHEVEQRRAFYPVKLQDGRQAVVPMDIVEVRYTGGWQ
jgi:hypothetical protein